MTTISQEMIAAYVDGELPEGEAAKVRQGQKDDPAIRESIARYRALRAEVEYSFRPIIRAPIPVRLRHLFEPQAGSPRAVSTGMRNSFGRVAHWVTPAAIAASLMIGVFAGNVMDGGDQKKLHFALDGDISDRAIHTLLLRQPSGVEKNGPNILATYRDENGDICREFVLGDTRSAQGLACLRADGNWFIVALTPAPPPGSYAPASGEHKAFDLILEDYVELSGDEEQLLLEKGWKD